jgi:Mobilization protein NikA
MTKEISKTPPPFSLRLTPEERAQLEKDAAGMTLSSYIRSRLFDENLPKRRTRNKHPVKDHQDLAKVLGELGRSRLANNVNQLAKTANSGSLEVSPDTEKSLQNACADIRWMRHVLLSALGLASEISHDS